HASPGLIVHASFAESPSVIEFGETLMAGGRTALTISVATAGTVGAGQVSVYVKVPADVGFTVWLPLPATGATNPGSLLLQVQALLPLVFQVSFAPVPSATEVGETLAVGCCTTVRVAD